jgi:hypothetical protein
MAFDLEPDARQVASVIATMPPPPDCDCIPTVAMFAAWALQRFPDAVADRMPGIIAGVFAAGEWQLALVPRDAIAVLVDAAGKIPEGQFLELVGHHEGRMLEALANLAKFAPE